MYEKGPRRIIGFPDQLATDNEKASVDYGLRVAQAIEAEWFRKESGTSRYYNNRDTYHKLRTYAMGEQSVQKYKDELAINGDISYLNLDWSPVPIIPKFVDIVVNGMSNRLYDVIAQAVDSISSNKKAMYKLKLKTEMTNREDFKQIEESLGISMFDTAEDELPTSKDELDLHVSLNYKDDIELAQEKAIETVLQLNDYDQIKRQIDEDQVTLGISAMRHSFNTHDGIKIDYIDPAKFIWSPTEDPNFEDCYYFGEVKNVNITELKKIDPSLTQEDISEISKMSSKFDSYQGIRGGYHSDNFDKSTATLLYFCYKTDKNIVYKKKKTATGGEKVLKKDDQFNPPKTEAARFEKLSKRIDVWYEGVYILGSNRMIQWQIMSNMVRPKSSINKVYAPFIVSAKKQYRGQIDSLVKRMVPFADQIQLIHLKLQQVTAKMIPDGVYMDIDGLSSINIGNGATYSPQEALNLYFQTGSVLGRSYAEDGEINRGKIPIQELTASGANNKISSLINMYNYNLGLIRSVTGLNEARDGSTPDPNSLVGVQKLAALNSNTATRHILESRLNMTRKLSECISHRMSDVLMYSDMRETFVNSIGRYSMDLIEEIKQMHLHDFGIFIQLHPDEEERNFLEQNIQQSLSSGKIDIDDAIDIRAIKNTKIASQLLKVRKKRKEKMDFDKQQAAIKAQSESNQQAALASEQAKQQTMLSKQRTETELKRLDAELEMQKMQFEADLKLRLMKEQKSLDKENIKASIDSQMSKEMFREDRKDKRSKLQASQQSQLIQQRKQDLDPIDFDGQDYLGSGLQGLESDF
tara:strand:- start:10203 stop:12626 length:2424 start_codon:yes stop_codon:yes gene_type:complete